MHASVPPEGAAEFDGIQHLRDGQLLTHASPQPAQSCTAAFGGVGGLKQQSRPAARKPGPHLLVSCYRLSGAIGKPDQIDATAMQQTFDLVGQIDWHAHRRSRCFGEEISSARPLYEITPRRYPETTAGERTGDIRHNGSIRSNYKSHQLL